MKPTLARKALTKAAHSAASLPNGGSRLACTLHPPYGERRSYIVHVFDRANPWIRPNFGKSFIGSTCLGVTLQAVNYIEAIAPRLSAMEAAVNAAIVTVQPFSEAAA